ncbi:MAG: hypothetical protein JO069_10710 [Verrucomicrobia bacterium]|nr:hypothetical protein [Verrucomicrobiota bacterium]
MKALLHAFCVALTLTVSAVTPCTVAGYAPKASALSRHSVAKVANDVPAQDEGRSAFYIPRPPRVPQAWEFAFYIPRPPRAPEGQALSFYIPRPPRAPQGQVAFYIPRPPRGSEGQALSFYIPRPPRGSLA